MENESISNQPLFNGTDISFNGTDIQVNSTEPIINPNPMNQMEQLISMLIKMIMGPKGFKKPKLPMRPFPGDKGNPGRPGPIGRPGQPDRDQVSTAFKTLINYYLGSMDGSNKLPGFISKMLPNQNNPRSNPMEMMAKMGMSNQNSPSFNPMEMMAKMAMASPGQNIQSPMNPMLAGQGFQSRFPGMNSELARMLIVPNMMPQQVNQLQPNPAEMMQLLNSLQQLSRSNPMNTIGSFPRPR